MINLLNVMCLKLRSNSGRKLLDNQLQYISNQYQIPISFLQDMRSKNFSKIFFEKKSGLNSLEIQLIGFVKNNEFELLEKFKKIPGIIKAQISIIESIPIPKETVNPNNYQRKNTKSDNTINNKKPSSLTNQNTSNNQTQNNKSQFKINNSKNNEKLNSNFILKINLRKSDKDLQEICEKTTLDFEFLKENSKYFSVLYFIQVANNNYLLFSYIKINSNKIELTNDFCEDLFKMKFTSFMLNEKSISNKPKHENEWDVDDILDKIQEYGINSLSKTEREFLESLADKSEQQISFKNPRTRKNSLTHICDEKSDSWETISKLNNTSFRLPEIDELEAIYEQLHKNGIGNFKDDIYWSATTFSDDTAWYFDFKKGTDGIMSKKSIANIRFINK